MQDRHTLWRIDSVTRLFFVVWPVLAVGGLILFRNNPAALSILPPGLGLIAAVAYLNGPSARVMIGPGEVVIVNPFERFIVPVGKIRGWDRNSGWQRPHLHVDGLPRPLPVLAFQPNKTIMDADTHELWVTQRMRCIDRAAAEQLSADASAEVVRRLRWSSILVVVAAPLLYAAMLLIGKP
ncbi:hypothetical protein AB0H43_22240 [Hamadaea sp. NPDC050747]|uniref:hypothetical protein n=1 Tax=Hamadaea sp. NPDC050747 TaxID=3155789 RepID=UPI0033E6B81F